MRQVKFDTSQLDTAMHTTAWIDIDITSLEDIIFLDVQKKKKYKYLKEYLSKELTFICIGDADDAEILMHKVAPEASLFHEFTFAKGQTFLHNGQLYVVNKVKEDESSCTIISASTVYQT